MRRKNWYKISSKKSHNYVTLSSFRASTLPQKGQANGEEGGIHFNQPHESNLHMGLKKFNNQNHRPNRWVSLLRGDLQNLHIN